MPATKPRPLTLKQALFCRYFVQNESLFGIATLSYAAAYGIDLDLFSREPEKDNEGKVIGPSDYDRQYNACSTSGSRLLRDVRIQTRITKLLNILLKDDFVDSQLAKVIAQDQKLEPKIAAIREYNKLRGRIIDKVDHTGEITNKVVILPARIPSGQPPAATKHPVATKPRTSNTSAPVRS